MHYKRLFIYAAALILLTLAVLACRPADESVQPGTDPQTAGAVNSPTLTLTPYSVEWLGGDQDTPGTQSGSTQEDTDADDPTATPQPTICVAWPTQEAGDPDTMCLSPESMFPAPTRVYDPLTAPTPTMAILQITAEDPGRYLREFEAMGEEDGKVALVFSYDSPASTTAACEWLVVQMGHTMETREVKCNPKAHALYGMIPASLVESLANRRFFMGFREGSYPKLQADVDSKVGDAEERAEEEIARGVAKDVSETAVASETLEVAVFYWSPADGPAIESWLKAKRLSYRKDSYETDLVYYVVTVPLLLLGALSELDAVSFILWEGSTAFP